MHPQQPYGYQQPQGSPYPQTPYQQTPYGQPQGWGGPATPRPSGGTAITSAVLGCLLGVFWLLPLIRGVNSLVQGGGVADALLAVGLSLTITASLFVGAVGLFLRRPFGKWTLVGGFALSILGSLLSGGIEVLITLVLCVPGLVLVLIPPTTRYLAAAKQQPGYPHQSVHPVQQPYGYPQQAYPQQGYPQPPQQGYPSQYPQRPGPPHY